MLTVLQRLHSYLLNGKRGTFDILTTMGNSSEFNVTRLSSLIGVVNAWSGPALTQYGQVRVELGGPVVARWLSKVANY